MNEASLAEAPALEWLKELEWEYIHGPEIAPGAPGAERERWADVLLVGRLRRSLVRLNPHLPTGAIEQVIRRALETASPNVVEDHAAFHDLLIDGLPVPFEDEAGEQRSERAILVDFDDPSKNEFLAVNQFTIVVGQKNRRPDVLMFVNGIPLGQIELKNPGSPNATAEGAVNQLHDYADAITPLYRFVEVMGVSDVHTARVGTLTSPAEHFVAWKSMDPAEDAGKSALEVMIRGVFPPAAFLDLIENFVLFMTDGARTFKVLAKYHQVDAVKRAIEATREAMGSDGRGGVVWHTQGAGKSYTMVFYAQMLRRDPAFANPTIVAITDRNDLDQQLYETFAAQRELGQSVRQAEEIAGGEESLHVLLHVPAGGIVFTTIQKFRPARGQTQMPVLTDRENVIVLADEAHRSHYDSFGRSLMDALPNAVRIGFTGTPIERGSRSTSLVFGDYISVYTVERSVEDGSTVPIYYENRRVPIEIEDESLLVEVEEVLEGEEDEARKKLVTSWAQLEKVVGAEDRLDKVADDIVDHYAKRCETLEGKALVVGMSRRICAQLTRRLKEMLSDEAVTCVMSVSAEDDAELHGPGGEYRRSKRELKQVAKDFKREDHALRIVVVRDMWLVGFDAPILHTIYIDKPMKDHGLLQAIARVNRVFRDKPGGLVVDFIGIGEDLRKSLSAYDPEDIGDVMVPLDLAIKRLEEKHDIVSTFFHGLPWQTWTTLSPTDQATLIANAHNEVVADDETAKRFLKEQALFARWYALVNPHSPAREMVDDAKFIGQIAGAVRKYTPLEAQASPQAEQAVKQFFSEGLAAGEIIDVLGMAGEERPEISVLSDEFLDTLEERIPQENLRLALMRKLLNDEVRVRSRRNPMQAQLFSDRIESVLARYRARQITSEEVIKALVDLAKEMREARRRHEQLGLTEEEAAFYDALAGGVEDGVVDTELAKIAHEVVTAIRARLEVGGIDWTSRESMQAEMRRTIKRLLRKHRYQPPPARPNGGGGAHRPMSLDDLTNLILEQARVLYAYWPEVFTAPLPLAAF
jgi:type I restriction enzyme R subunit